MVRPSSTMVVVYAYLQLGDQVLLITSFVAMEDDLLCGDALVVVTDVEEIADFISIS